MSHGNEMSAAPRAPRFAGGWAALVYMIAAFTLAYPVFGGKILLARHSDQFLAGYSFREYAAASLKAGQGFPEWNAFLNGGMPYVAAVSNSRPVISSAPSPASATTGASGRASFAPIAAGTP